jgi:murein L,D-transpeptidase YcbB/YkuD
MTGFRQRLLGTATLLGLVASALATPAAAAPKPPVDLLPAPRVSPSAQPTESQPTTPAKPAKKAATQPTTTATPPPGSSPPPGAAPNAAGADAVTAPVEAATPMVVVEPIMHWTLADARSLLAVINGINAEGLVPADYKPATLKAAIATGEGAPLDETASKSLAWLIEDLRDGRTPMEARVQWFAVDQDVLVNPTDAVMRRALDSHDIAGTLAQLDPTYPDYAVLRDALATTPKSDSATRNLIRVNMDRWRWFTRDMGEYYLMTNVPEFQLRLVRRDKIIRTYRTIVGKPGKTATPQLAEKVEGVIFNPTWTVPQSIVQGEGLGARLVGSPAEAKREGYAVTKGTDGTITVVQQPGPKNALGQVKLDMPNPHAIFLHDTPARSLFATDNRAYSHGCIRTERATELAITLSILQAGKTPEEAVAISTSGQYTKIPFTTTMPIYIGYFTMAKDINGQLSTFNDLYGRDAAVLTSFTQPRVAKTGQRTSNEPVVAIDAPGA